MKIVVYGPERRTGALRDGSVVDLSYAYAKYAHEKNGEAHPLALAAAMVPSDLARLIEAGPRALDNIEASLDYLFGQAQDQKDPRGAALVYPAAAVRMHAPRPNGARIACAGGNFADHAAAMAERMQRKPYTGDARAQIRNAGIWGFWKVHREVAGPDGEVIYPAKANRLDYEGELAIVLSKRGTDIRPQDAKDYVWGVTLLGDWSIRNPREPAGPHNFAMGKNFDTSCSLGPCIAVGEADPFATDVETLVNGEQRQSFNTRDMVFSFGEYLEYLSRDLTLFPGDIISGGTAAGTAADFEPAPRRLHLAARALSETRRHRRYPLAGHRNFAQPYRRQAKPLTPIPVAELVWLAAAVMAAGVVTGILAGLFGIGGGAVIVPVLYEFFGLLGVPEEVRMQLCIGTSLAIIVPTTVRSYRTHRARGLVIPEVLRLWTMPAILGVAIGSAAAAFAPAGLFKIVFAVIAAIIATKLLFGRENWVIGSELPGRWAMRGYGFLMGLASSLMGISGGSLVTMVLTLYRRSIHQSVATASGIGVPITIAGTVGYALAGLPHQALLPPLSVGFVSAIGVLLIAPISSYVAPIGARLAHRLNRRTMEVGFGLFLLLASLRFVVSLLFPV